MIYELLKAAHIVALFVWIGGMVAVALALRYPSAAHMKPLKAYDSAVTTPAMIAVFVFGITIGMMGGHFTSLWLGVKIVLVLGLAGLHGALSGRLRRATGSDAAPEASGKPFLPVGFALITAIVLLVVLKP